MRSRRGGGGRRAGQSSQTTDPGLVSAYRRVDRTVVVAVVLSALTLLSVVALPVVAAGPPAGKGPEVTAGGGDLGGGSSGSTGGGSSGGAGGSSGVSGGSGVESTVAETTGSAGNSGNGGSGVGGVGGAPGSNSASDEDGNDVGVGDGNGNAGGVGNSVGGENGNGVGVGGGNGIAGSGPPVEVTVGPPADPGDGQADPLGQVAGAPERSAVSVEVRGASAGADVSIDVSPPSVEDESVAFDGISVTVKRDGDFTMRVTNSREPLPGSPAFEPGDGADALGRVRLEHSISNEEVEDVSFEFRVSKARLRAFDTDPEEVVLYRHADGSWTALPTDVIGETQTHYLLRAESPGMSEFAIGAMRPKFDTWWADVESGTTSEGDPVAVSGRVTNVGGADGVFDATLAVDGEVVAERQVTIAAQGTRQVNFRAAFDRPGTYQLSIDGTPAGTVTVRERAERPEPATGGEPLAIALDRLLDIGRGLPSPTIPTVPSPDWP